MIQKFSAGTKKENVSHYLFFIDRTPQNLTTKQVLVITPICINCFCSMLCELWKTLRNWRPWCAGINVFYFNFFFFISHLLYLALSCQSYAKCVLLEMWSPRPPASENSCVYYNSNTLDPPLTCWVMYSVGQTESVIITASLVCSYIH